jgi:hypothetical protein
LEEILDFGQGHRLDTEAMLAWIGWVKAMAFWLMEIGMAVTNEDLALTMGLDVLYESFIISLDGTQPELLTIDYVIHCLLNEDVCHDNQEQGKENDEKKEVKHKKDKDNVALSAILSSGPCVCWRCGKPGHIRAFCQEEPIHGQESGKANVTFAVHDDADIWLDEVSQSSNSDI